MRIYSALLKAALLFYVFSQSANAATKPQFVYVGNTGDDSVSVFSIQSNGTLKPLEPRIISPMCGMPSLLATAGRVLLAGGEYTAVCSGPDLGGGAVYLYPIQSSGKLGTVSVSYLNDVESIALDRAGKLAFASGASLNPHAEAASINGWNVSKANLETSLPSSPTNFFDFQTGDGFLPLGLAVSSNANFLYATFSKFSNYNDVGGGQLGVLSLLLDGGIGSFVNKPVPGCIGTKISGGRKQLSTVTLESKIVIYQPCLKGAAVNVVGTPVIGFSVINSSTGKIEKTYDAFLPPSGMSLAPVTVDPTGHWLAASNGAGEIDILAINQSTGTLSELAHHVFNVAASSVAFDHTGKFLYAAQTKKNVVAAFDFDSKTGTVKLPTLGTQGTGPAPTVVVVAQP
jgi:Lactonase, 7-bladed beta-propeller